MGKYPKPRLFNKLAVYEGVATAFLHYRDALTVATVQIYYTIAELCRNESKIKYKKERRAE